MPGFVAAQCRPATTFGPQILLKRGLCLRRPSTILLTRLPASRLTSEHQPYLWSNHVWVA